MPKSSMSAVAAAPLPATTGAPKIEITPAMIEAGVLAMLPFEDTFDDTRGAAQRVFLAMIKASRPG